MSTPYVGEIRLFAFGRIPTGWQACDGSLLSIAQYETLYTLLGVTYGGNATTTFGVPDLRGRIPLHNGTGLGGLTPRVLGQSGGAEQITLTTQQIPQHNHNIIASTTAATTSAPGPTTTLGACTGDTPYVTFPGAPPASLGQMAAQTIAFQGQGLPHQNCMPTTTMSYCIAWAGVFPTHN